MSLNVNNFKPSEKKDHGLPKLGAHYARLVAVIDLGIQERRPYKGVPKPPCRQINMIYELTDDFVVIDGVTKPRWISRNENAFTGAQANLPAVIRALDPEDKFKGDLAALALSGAPCLVTIGPKLDVNGKPVEGVKITDVGAVPALAAAAIPPLANTPIVFDFDNPEEATYARLHNWVRNRLKEAKNYPGSSVETMVQAFEVKQAAEGQAKAAAQPQPTPTPAPVAQVNPTPTPAAPPTPVPPPAPPAAVKAMTEKAAGATYEQFVAAGWTDTMLVEQGYMQVATTPLPAPKAPVPPVPVGRPY